MPQRPAVRGPDGDTEAATAISRCGRLYGASCSLASRSSNQSVFIVTTSPRSSGMIASQRLAHHVALPARIDAEHHRVGRQQARADAEHRAAARQVIELRHAIGHHQRLVVGQRDDAGAETDVLGARRDVGDEQLGAGDDLVAGGVVLADPGLVEAELVEPLNELAIALETERRVLVARDGTAP